MTDKKLSCADAPCKSCPYRRDVPSGVWAAHEYEKLECYDGPPIEQIIFGGTGLFLCHQRDNHLCAGWVAAHGPRNLIALSIHADEVEASVFGYHTETPVFASGKEASTHGQRDITNPGDDARRVVGRLWDKISQKGE
jgi:hypothetical protein